MEKLQKGMSLLFEREVSPKISTNFLKLSLTSILRNVFCVPMIEIHLKFFIGRYQLYGQKTDK